MLYIHSVSLGNIFFNMQDLLESGVRQILMTVMTRTVIKAHVLTVLRKHFATVQLGRWDRPVTKVSPGVCAHCS